MALLKLQSVADDMDISVNKLKDIIDSGLLPVVDLGSRTKRIDEVDYNAFKTARKQ